MGIPAPVAASALVLLLMPSPASAGLGNVVGEALECGTIGEVGMDRCEEGEAPSSPYACEHGGSDPDLRDLEEAVRRGMEAGGYAPRPDSVHVTRQADGRMCFSMRLNKNNRPLPSLACIRQHLHAGNVEDGTVSGAWTWVIGCVQQHGGQSRVNVREVDFPTGIVDRTGRADADGTGPDAIEEGVREAVRRMLDASP